MVSPSKRNPVFDVMKGIGIILMLIGHWPGLNEHIVTFIYSFHMPMFFIISGYFSKEISDWPAFICQLKKDAKRLLVPVLFTHLLLIIYWLIKYICSGEYIMLIRSSLTLLWGGTEIGSPWGILLSIWFLPALFIAKTLLNILSTWGGQKNAIILIVCATISISAVILARFITLPWCILQGCSALIFVDIGYLAKRYKPEKWFYIICILCWLCAIIFSRIEMYSCSYRYYPLDVLGALGGTLAVYWLSKLITKSYILSKPLLWCGSFSLIIYCMDYFTSFSSILNSIIIHSPLHNVELSDSVSLAIRYILVLIFSFTITKLPYINRMYGVNSKRLIQ